VNCSAPTVNSSVSSPAMASCDSELGLLLSTANEGVQFVDGFDSALAASEVHAQNQVQAASDNSPQHSRVFRVAIIMLSAIAISGVALFSITVARQYRANQGPALGSEHALPISMKVSVQDPLQRTSVSTKLAPKWAGAGFIRNLLSGKCLDVFGSPGTSVGAPILLWNCEDGPEYNIDHTDQRWVLSPKGFLVNRLTALCLGIVVCHNKAPNFNWLSANSTNHPHTRSGKRHQKASFGTFACQPNASMWRAKLRT